jgi:bacteriorhodopsin
MRSTHERMLASIRPAAWRRYIAAGYLLPALLLVLAMRAAPPNAGKLGDAAYCVLAAEGSLFVGLCLLLAGTGLGVATFRQARGAIRWYDYLFLVAGAVPLLAVVVSALLFR